MKADLNDFYLKIKDMDKSSLVDTIMGIYQQFSDLQIEKKSNEDILTQMSIQYKDLESKCNELQIRNKELEVLLAKEIDKNSLRNKAIYGRKTESILSLMDNAEIFEDEADTEDNDVYAANSSPKVVVLERARNTVRKNPCKNQKTLADSMKNLPHRYEYNLNIQELDERYGKGNWRISFWKPHSILERTKMVYYTKVIYTPVISEGTEHILSTVSYQNELMDKSNVSPSIMSELVYRKCCMCNTYGRVSMDFNTENIYLSKQTIIHWCNRIIPKLFQPVYDHLLSVLVGQNCIQSDETYLTVNKDGYGPGHKSYLWVHATSELSTDKPVVIFCYTPTRSTDHLREYFGEFLGYMVSDAYISYLVMEGESKGNIQIQNCMMHARRYLAESFFLHDPSKLNSEELSKLPETKALLLIREIYEEENKLKDMSAKDRYTERLKTVKPKMNAFFSYIHELKDSKEVYSERLNKAITYVINQESRLQTFLKDGSIPIDNGHSERIIAGFARCRSNFLFADTVQGAKVYALMHTVVETARANSVNVRIYLNYLFENLPKEYTDIEDMMPWSEKYKVYAQRYHESALEEYGRLFPVPDKPNLYGKLSPPQVTTTA